MSGNAFDASTYEANKLARAAREMAAYLRAYNRGEIPERVDTEDASAETVEYMRESIQEAEEIPAEAIERLEAFAQEAENLAPLLRAVDYLAASDASAKKVGEVWENEVAHRQGGGDE